ncbi:P-loop NTPase fold protein [Bacillus cereus]|uniref:P-loop NTPase fold protein n=1 Tax=Bacillus cereus TaxID=1396 RepID=UPI002D789BB2|nr:P-loop NTPase fold protein [Bacillus cereus]
MSTSTSESVQTSLSESEKYTVDSILDYVKRENTSYAILLNGEWGSGKTYFWENVLKEEITKIDKKIIYVSLYGVNSIEDINNKIFLGQWGESVQEFTESKWGGRLTEITKAMLGSVKSIEIPFIKATIEPPEIDFGQFINFTNTVLCFDDLERASIDINKVLGYINNFVEHDGIKVILIANENEIEAKLNDKNAELKMLTTCFYTDKKGEFDQENGSNSDQKEININGSDSNEKKIPINELITSNLKDLFQKNNEYKRIKEKLIGKTLTLQLDEKLLIEDIVNQTSNEKQNLQSFLEDNLVTIENTYKESDSKNIRVLIHALEDFDLIYQYFNECGYEIDGILKSILKFVLAASFEIKTNVQNNEVLERINSHKDLVDTTGLSDIFTEEEKKYPEKFKKKYYNEHAILYQRAFFKFAVVLIRKGIFNKELFKREMDNFQLELKEIEIKDPHIEFITGAYWNMTDDEFGELERNTYNKLKNGEIHFAWYFRAYQTYEFFRRKGIISIEEPDLKQELIEGLKKAGERGSYTEYTFTMFLLTELRNEENLDEENLDEFKEMIKKINDGLKVKKEKEDVQSLFKLMRKDFNSFSRKMNENDLYINIPFFAHCDPEEFCATIINSSTDNIQKIRGFIRNRKEFVGLSNYSYLQTELPNLKKIKCKLSTEIKSQKMAPRLVSLMWLVEDIGRLEDEIKTLNNTAQQPV